MTHFSTKNNSFKTKHARLLLSAGVFVFWLAVWEIASAVAGKEVLLPSPFAVGKRLFELGATAPFWISTGMSLLRISIGFLVGTLVGLVLGFLSYRYIIIRYIFSPILAVVRATPVASFIILALVWLSNIRVPSFAAFLIVLPVVSANTYTALEQTDKQLLEMTELYRFGIFRRIKNVYVHSFLPYFASSAKMSLGMAWKAGIAAEVLCTPRGSIGKELYEAKIYLETTDVFAWTAVVIILSLVFEKLMALLFKRFSAERKSKNEK